MYSTTSNFIISPYVVFWINNFPNFFVENINFLIFTFEAYSTKIWRCNCLMGEFKCVQKIYEVQNKITTYLIIIWHTYIINSPHYFCTFIFNVKYDILYIYVLHFFLDICMCVLYWFIWCHHTCKIVKERGKTNRLSESIIFLLWWIFTTRQFF
jgi:hypothetical protein